MQEAQCMTCPKPFLSVLLPSCTLMNLQVFRICLLHMTCFVYMLCPADITLLAVTDSKLTSAVLTCSSCSALVNQSCSRGIWTAARAHTSKCDMWVDVVKAACSHVSQYDRVSSCSRGRTNVACSSAAKARCMALADSKVVFTLGYSSNGR